MDKIDLKKELKSCYSSKKSVTFIEVPAIKYISVHGSGNPGTSKEYTDAIEALYGLAYTVKFLYKDEGKDFVVMPLEGHWYCENIEEFSLDNRDEWLWEMMIALPDFVTQDKLDLATENLKKKKNPISLDKVESITHQDGLSAQFLYIGAYADEAPFIKEMHDLIKEKGYKPRGKHREIYLSDPRRVAPEKLKTIIRQPVC